MVPDIVCVVEVWNLTAPDVPTVSPLALYPEKVFPVGENTCDTSTGPVIEPTITMLLSYSNNVTPLLTADTDVNKGI